MFSGSEFLLVITFMFVVGASLIIRAKSGGKYEVKAIDVVVGLTPFLIWLLVSGNLAEFSVGDLSLKLRETSRSTISKQISKLSSEGEILSIGVDCIYAHEDDIHSLETFPTYRPFRFIIIEDQCEDDERGESNPIFVGMLSVEDYKRYFLGQNTKLSGKYFLSLVKKRAMNSIIDLGIPSFVSINNAVNPNTEKLTALKIIEELNVEALPVVSDDKYFIGIVSRSELVVSFVVDMAESAN
ncbi:CBS domain-containing protein [Rheinheimera sp.]|uniref:CBS domain-containing protein n=1 Tax=Rheinheimera sp. TaxID=1869214 RepID=UPI00307E9C9F